MLNDVIEPTVQSAISKESNSLIVVSHTLVHIIMIPPFSAIIFIYSYYLYEISHPNKTGIPQISLVEDPEVKIDIPSSLCPSQAAVERVIAKVFFHFHVDIIITDRLRSLFYLKLWRMGKSIQGLGGSARNKRYDKWKGSKWVIELEKEEIVLPPNCKIKPDNNNMTKRIKLEDQLSTANEKLKDLTNKYTALENSCKELSNSIAVDGRASAVHTRKRKAWTECTPQHQKKRIKQVAKKVQTALLFTNDEHLKPTKLEFKNEQTGDTVSINSNGQIVKTIEQDSQAAATSGQAVVDQTLYVKEKFNVSNEAYHEMAMVNTGMPRLNSLLKKAKTLDTGSIIYPVQGKLEGVQQSLKKCLENKIHHLQKINPAFCTDRVVHVKLTGDGTSVSRNIHLLVIAFVVIQDEVIANSPSDHCTIALINTTENYESLSECVEDIVSEMKSLDTLKVGNYTYATRFFLGADMKFLALCIGIEAANSTYACVWCKCPSSYRHDLTKNWSVTDKVNGGARSIEEIQKCAKLKKNKKNEKYGCINQPLFPCIPIKYVIPDILHLFLRISDILTNLLIMELRRMDGLDKVNPKSLSQDNANHLTRYEKFLNEKCKVSFHFYTDKDSKQVKWRDLVGPEKIKLFSKFVITDLFPDFPQGDKVQKIWKDFMVIYDLLRCTNTKKEQIKELAIKWLKLFLEVYQTRHVTPYMHTLVFHIPEFIELYGSLAPFSQQGLERLNDCLTKDYFRSTNHRQDALKTLLLKLNRLEELQSEERHKREHHCRLCNNLGHNSRTCPLKQGELHTDTH